METRKELEYVVGEIVVVRPLPGTDCQVPAEVIEITHGSLRRDVQYASGRVENVGVGNMRRAQEWQIASFREMRRSAR